MLGEKRKPVPGRKPWKMFVLPEAGERRSWGWGTVDECFD